jgi:hypothetical protein
VPAIHDRKHVAIGTYEWDMIASILAAPLLAVQA